MVTHSSGLLVLVCPLTARPRTVSGSISLPSPGSFSPFPHGTKMFLFPDWPPVIDEYAHEARGFPHSDIGGSKAGRRFPAAFRRRPASFFGIWRPGIPRPRYVRHTHTTPSLQRPSPLDGD